MEINDLQKWNIANEICGHYNFEALITQLKNMHRPSDVKLISKTIDFQTSDTYKPVPYQVIIIDFEGSP